MEIRIGLKIISINLFWYRMDYFVLFSSEVIWSDILLCWLFCVVSIQCSLMPLGSKCFKLKMIWLIPWKMEQERSFWMSAKISITTRIFSKTLLFRSLLNNQLAYLLVPLLYVCVCVCVCIFILISFRKIDENCRIVVPCIVYEASGDGFFSLVCLCINVNFWYMA